MQNWLIRFGENVLGLTLATRPQQNLRWRGAGIVYIVFLLNRRVTE